jgi:hypothetical protein
MERLNDGAMWGFKSRFAQLPPPVSTQQKADARGATLARARIATVNFIDEDLVSG